MIWASCCWPWAVHNTDAQLTPGVVKLWESPRQSRGLPIHLTMTMKKPIGQHRGAPSSTSRNSGIPRRLEPIGKVPSSELVWRFKTFDPILEKDQVPTREKRRHRDIRLTDDLKAGSSRFWWQPVERRAAPIGRGTYKQGKNVFANQSDWATESSLSRARHSRWKTSTTIPTAWVSWTRKASRFTWTDTNRRLHMVADQTPLCALAPRIWRGRTLEKGH